MTRRCQVTEVSNPDFLDLVLHRERCEDGGKAKKGGKVDQDVKHHECKLPGFKVSSLFFNLNLCDHKAGKQVLKKTSFGDESEFVF